MQVKSTTSPLPSEVTIAYIFLVQEYPCLSAQPTKDPIKEGAEYNPPSYVILQTTKGEKNQVIDWARFTSKIETLRKRLSGRPTKQT